MEFGKSEMRNTKKIYQTLYEQGPFSEAEMKKLLGEEGFERQWIPAQNSHRKRRMVIGMTSKGKFYGLSNNGMEQLRSWETKIKLAQTPAIGVVEQVKRKLAKELGGKE
jgi:hypothetical protein